MMITGQVVLFGGEPHRVASVNESRAVLVPVKKRPVAFATVEGDKKHFAVSERSINVSPQSELQVLGSWQNSAWFKEWERLSAKSSCD